MNTILAVEDSSESFELIRRSLGSSARLEWAKTLKEAMRFLETKKFDLILLDVVLPDGDGYQLCSQLQTNDELKKIPLIFLTAKTSVPDKVLGFSVGCDDFVSKPFDPIELRSRVEARLRRRNRAQEQAQRIQIGEIDINLDSQKVNYYRDEELVEIDLTAIEFKILVMIAKRANQVVSRDEILESVWGENVHVFSRSVDTHVSKLRKKLREKSDHVESVHGSGYRFVIPERTRPPRNFQHDTRISLEAGRF